MLAWKHQGKCFPPPPPCGYDCKVARMWNSSRGFAGRWFARQRLARRMPTEDEDAGVADSAWRVRMGALEPACLSVCPSVCPWVGGGRPGDMGAGDSRRGGSDLDYAPRLPLWDLRAPPCPDSPCPSCDWGGGRAAGGFDQAGQVVLGFEQPGHHWLRELKVENTGLHLEAWPLFRSTAPLLHGHG